jgi:hypothetical protein
MLLNEPANFLMGLGHVREERGIAVVAVLLEPLAQQLGGRHWSCSLQERRSRHELGSD